MRWLDAPSTANSDCGCDDSVSTFGTVRLDSAASVERVLQARTHWRVFMPRFQISLPERSDDSARLQKRVDTLADACGCDLGAAMALIAAGSWLAYSVIIGPSYGLWGTTWRAAAVMFAGATIGKLVGIGRARIELRRVLLEIRELM